MRDNQKTKDELLQEVETLRRHLTKLSQTERELRESEQKWRSLLSNTPDIIMIVDRDGTIQFINHTVPGIKEQEATGKKVYDYISPEHHDTMKKNLEQIFTTGQGVRHEISGVGPHGDLSWYQAEGGPIKQNGRTTAASIVTRDITEHKQREKELEDSEEKYRTLSGNIPGMIYRAKADWSAEFFSHSEAVCCGYLIEDLKNGKIKWLDIIHPDDKQRVFDEGSELARKPGTLTQQYRILAGDGSVRWVEDHKTSTFTKEGKLVGVDGVVFDITERRLAEEALRLRNVAIESSINGVAFVDLEGNLFYANDSFLKLWGYNDEKQVLGKPAVGFWADVNKAAEIREVVNNKGGWTGELVARRKDGSNFDVELSASLVKDENDNPVCSMASFVDITERKNTEQSLRESEERLRAALSSAQMGTWRWDPATNQDTRGASFNGILGLEAVESTQPVEDFLQRVHPEDRDMVESEIQCSLREHCMYLAEFRIIRPDGTVRWLRDQGKPLYGENNQLLYLTGAVVDITEHKQAEDALRESEKRFREIFENTAVGMYRTTPDGQILMANPALVHMLGYSSFEEINQRNLEEEGFEPQYERSTFKKEIERKGRIVSLESTWITRNGKELHVIENARAVRDENGKTLYYEGTAENITERKKAEDALRESEERYRTLVESAGESIAMFDNKGSLLFINERGAKQLGGKSRDFIGKTMWDLFPKKIADRQAGSVRKVIRTEKELKDITLTELQGRPRWYNTTIVPLRNSIGKVTSALVMARDIHEQKQAEEALNEYREKITHAERLITLGTLSAIMAHKLSSHLMAIRVSIENSLEELSTISPPNTIIEDLNNSLSSLYNVVSEVDKIRHLANKPSEEFISEVNVKAVAERIVNLLKENAQRARVILHLKNMDKLPTIYSNEQDIEQLFIALVENALQAADRKRNHRLVISGDVKGKQIELRFADTCGGIAKRNLDKIFEPFFTTRPPGEGTGLGLYIVENIVSKAGGKVCVESKTGKGSTFFITLPINK